MKRVEGGDYLGDISALCFLHLPPNFSSFPFLLAGTGSQLLLIDINGAKQINSFRVFEGVRVHGIASSTSNSSPPPPPPSSSSSSLTFTILVSGEKRVKLYCLHFHGIASVEFTLLQLLPRFSHWVLDFCFLKEQGNRYLAVGCSDNSLHIWDTFTSTFVFQLTCPERCLLYSMRLLGNAFKDLHIASGTIYNEIVVWKLGRQCSGTALSSTVEESGMMSSYEDGHSLDCHAYDAVIVSKLAGHQGSIFCLSWSSDGSKLVSVSDDRSARLWITDAKVNTTDNIGTSLGPYFSGHMLFGHDARVWDCCISDSVIVTAGEDCTCRVWGMDGKELIVIKEHMGRGIWRCLYDPNSSLLVTAGFDSAIKAHCLRASSCEIFAESIKKVNQKRMEVFKSCVPSLSGHIGHMDSKSEYIRCMKFAREDTVYVATNHGFVFHAKLSNSRSVEWTILVRDTEDVPIICMDLFSRNHSESPLEVEDWIAVGDGKGFVNVIKVIFDDCTPKVAVRVAWSAEMERQLLGAYWCKSLGSGFIFTSNPKGLVKLWRWSDPLSHGAMSNCDAYLVADFMSPFGMRIMCLDASRDEEVLVCGDLRGNLVLFPLSKNILFGMSPRSSKNIPPLTNFKGAHGISTVSSISISRISSTLVEIRSTGADGCICYLEYDRDQGTLEFVGMKQIKALSLIQSVSSDHYSVNYSTNCIYAVGFSSSEFLIWNLLTERKLLQVKCGGWRRPHSYHLSRRPEICSSFAYVKDEVIYIHRYMVPEGEKNIFPRNLHLQFHGREIHTLCIISKELKSASNAVDSFNPKSSWIATGCEDGTVRLTRYSPGAENWSTSDLLGEHVGGSAVRSICFVSNVHCVGTELVHETKETRQENSSSEHIESPCLLISVGAKRVLTSWLLSNRHINESDTATYGPQKKYDSLKCLSGDPSMSFKWLSTDMPVKFVLPAKKIQDGEILVKPLDKLPGDTPGPNLKMEPKQLGDALDNDWRYLAVTAFLVGVADSRLTVCFIIVASSDASLTLRALVLPYRCWYDVAYLVPLSSPVLALQHAVIPLHLPHQGSVLKKIIYIVISGSTDGSIAFWDLSECVEAFMQRVSSLHAEKFIDFQKRPRTGRGSQGGRWWRSIDAALTAKRVSTPSMSLNDNFVPVETTILDGSPTSLILEDKKRNVTMQTDSVGSQKSFDDSSARIPEIKPLNILSNVHQSGVNCLHICSRNIGNNLEYSIVSGGDDQALNFMQFVMLPVPRQSNSYSMQESGAMSGSGNSKHVMNYYPSKSYSVRFLCKSKAVSAHSSAIKGVWTDGIQVFSTGLDQRVRCWVLQEHGNLTEYGHFVTSVPEPEALDVRACGRKCYQVVVAGRGMQMVEFSLPYEEEGSD